jgi:hypothetical protein
MYSSPSHAGIDSIESKDKPDVCQVIFDKIRVDRFLNSICCSEKNYLVCTVNIYASFGIDEPELQSRTQVT